MTCCHAAHTVLWWWRRRVQCQGHLSDKQSRCLTLTNSPPGLGPPPRQSSAATSTQSAETCSCCSKDSVPLPLTTTANTQRNPTGHLVLCVCGALLPLSPAALELRMIVFSVMGKRLLCIQLVFIYTKGLLSPAYPHIKVKLFLHCGCNLN